MIERHQQQRQPFQRFQRAAAQHQCTRHRNLAARLQRQAPLFADELFARETAQRQGYFQGEDHDKQPSMIAFASRASALVAAADPAAVAAVLADFPEAEENGLRADPASFKPHRKPPPKDPTKRA